MACLICCELLATAAKLCYVMCQHRFWAFSVTIASERHIYGLGSAAEDPRFPFVLPIFHSKMYTV